MSEGAALAVRGALTSGFDQAAFGAFYAEHAGHAYRLALRLCGDPARAEDAVAEPFARTWVPFRAGRVTDPGAYLRRAVVNQVTSGWRRRASERRWGERRRGDDRGQRSLEDAAADTALFRAALDRLPPRQRAAVVLRYYEDLPDAEIAGLLGCSVGTVKSQVHRGLARLRELVGHHVVGIAPDATFEGGDR